MIPELFDQVNRIQLPTGHVDVVLTESNKPSLSLQQQALWANHILGECLREAGDDVDAGLAAAEYILSTQPIPQDISLAVQGKGQWVTIGGKPDSETGEMHVGGFPVYVDEDGRILKGRMTGKNIKDVKKAYDKRNKTVKKNKGKAVEDSKQKSIVSGARPELTEDEVDALDHYTASAWINDELRGLPLRPEATRFFTEARRNEVRHNLTSAFKKAKEMPSPILVHRGKGFDSAEEMEKFLTNVKEAYSTGREIVEKGYMSTSTDKGSTTGYKGEHGVSVEVEVIRGLDLKHYGAGGVGEFLLDHGSRFKVKSIRTDDNGQPIVTLTQLSSKPSARLSISAFFSYDIHNRQAQGILNRSLKSAKGLSAAAKKDLTTALKRSDSGEAILAFIHKYRLQLAKLLTATQLASVLEGAQEVANKVPPLGTVPVEGLPVVEQERIVSLPPTPPFTPPKPLADSPEEIHFPTIEEAVKNLAERNVLTRPQYDALEAAARAKAFTVANVSAEETLTKIRDSLSANVREGADYATWREKVLEDVDQGTFMSEAHQENVFRTNVQSAFSDGQMVVLQHPLVRSGFPYSAYNAIHDDRVRENHLALEHHGIQETNIYRNDDPVFQLFRPPWDYNDRCSWTPITVQHAAEKGIKEAQEWVRTGVEPAERAFVPMPPFAPPEGFQRAITAAPLSIRLSLQSMAAFSGFDPDEPRDESGRWTTEGVSERSHPKIPAIVYTGQPKGLDEFEQTERNELPYGYAFFSDSKEVAERYAGTAESELSGAHNYSLGRKGEVYHVHLDIKNPMDLDEFDEDEWAKYLLPDIDVENEGYNNRQLAEALGLKRETEFDDELEKYITTGYLTPSGRMLNQDFDLAEAAQELWNDRSGGGDTLEYALGDSASGQLSVMFPEEARRYVEAKGYDGYIFTDAEMGGSTIVPFESEQITIIKKVKKSNSSDKNRKVLSIEQPESKRTQLISEIIVLLFGDEAEAVAERIFNDDDEDTDVELSIALATPKVTKRYGRRPGPGWVPGGLTRRGVQIWLYGTRAPSAASPTPAPVTPPPTPVPTPPTPVSPSPTPAPIPTTPGGTRARAQSVAAHTAAMAQLSAGQTLTPAEKLALSRKLTNMPIGLLRSLHTALGGTAAVGGAKATVAAVKAILIGASTPVSTPTPTPVAVPTPATPTPATNRIGILPPHLQGVAMEIRATSLAFQDGLITFGEAAASVDITLGGITSSKDYAAIRETFKLASHVSTSLNFINAATLDDPGHVGSSPPGPPPRAGLIWNPTTHRWILPAVAPVPVSTPTPTHTPISVSASVPDETTWETGKPQPGTLNGVDFSSAPPKFWEKVKDVDVKEPPSLKKIDRAGVLIQEPDGRIWIVQPTNEFGTRKYTLPGGGVEAGLTDQQNALKEVWEETGLQVEITGYAGDFEDSNTKHNGRLYIGKRIGGAPWDAKIESKIISQKTGKPAAESETVMLVTPKKAAELLHRTDDLAQLAMVHPIDLKTNPTKNVVNKIVKGVQAKAKQYEDEKKATRESPGDTVLHVIQEMRGFNNKPAVVNKSDFDTLMSQGNHIEMLRGITDIPPSSQHSYSVLTPKQMADQFKTGDHFPGHGMYGVGTYADATKGSNNVASGTYSGYSNRGEVIRIAMPKSAKIVKYSELKRSVSGHPDDYTVPSGKSKGDYWKGIHAALAGYDAIEVDDSYNGNSYYVLLNRSILTVQDKAPPKGYSIS